MAREIVFLHALHEHNRPLWYRSFPFHFGLYLLIGAVAGVLVDAAVLALTGATVPGPIGVLLRAAYAAAGAAGLGLTVCGAIALFAYRRTSPALRNSTTPGDLFNLLFFAAALGLVAAGVITAPAGSPGLLAIAAGALTWNLSLDVPGMLAAGLILTALLVAYIPLTHMSHFIGKYFTYHAVRWDDRPLAGNRRIAAALAESLTYRSRWSAGHVAGGKIATWADVVAADPSKEGRR
jgi:nitrate reductase gamma subunit